MQSRRAAGRTSGRSSFSARPPWSPPPMAISDPGIRPPRGRLPRPRGFPLPPRRPPVRVRLSLLMLLLYAAPGAMLPVFSLRLQELGFSPALIGWACATQALGSLLAPPVAGRLADRRLPADRLLAACLLASAALLALLSVLTAPAAVLAASVAFWLVMAPSLTLSATVCFANLPSGRDYGRVRLWGTVGWVLPGWLLGQWLGGGFWPRVLVGRPGELADAFRLAALLSAVAAAYALTLPRTPPPPDAGGSRLEALQLLRGRSFAAYAVCTLGLCVVLPFHSQATPLLLESLGVSRAWIPPALTIAQASEVTSLALLPLILGRFGQRRTMLLGLAAGAATMAALMLGRPAWLALAGMGLYGLVISCYLVAGQMFIHGRAPAHLRASAQGLHSFLCGMGLLLGNLLVGW